MTTIKREKDGWGTTRYRVETPTSTYLIEHHEGYRGLRGQWMTKTRRTTEDGFIVWDTLYKHFLLKDAKAHAMTLK